MTPEPTEAQQMTMADIERRCFGHGRPHPAGGWVHGGGVSTLRLLSDGSIVFGATGDSGSERRLIAPDGSTAPLPR